MHKDQFEPKPSPIEKPEAEKYIPEIEFGIDPNYDKDICFGFWRRHQYVLDELKYLLDIKDEDIVKQEIDKFVDAFYQKNQADIQEKLVQGQKQWSELADTFFAKVDKIFQSYPWPQALAENQGKYQAMGSIWHRYPRNIKHQRFSIPANPSFKYHTAPHVIAHEMLHFITYDYLEKKYGLQASESKDPKNPDNPDYDNTFWQFTENLNVLIENDPMWAEFSDGKVSKPYPDCQELYEKMKVIWDQNKDIDNLVRQIFNVS